MTSFKAPGNEELNIQLIFQSCCCHIILLCTVEAAGVTQRITEQRTPGRKREDKVDRARETELLSVGGPKVSDRFICFVNTNGAFINLKKVRCRAATEQELLYTSYPAEFVETQQP